MQVAPENLVVVANVVKPYRAGNVADRGAFLFQQPGTLHNPVIVQIIYGGHFDHRMKKTAELSLAHVGQRGKLCQSNMPRMVPVSYTHLDVYKRQLLQLCFLFL